MQGKYEASGRKRRRRGLGGRTVVLLMALVLVLGCAIGGTLAWLLDASGEVKNTFTPSDISIELKEDAGSDDYKFQMIPGYTITKDPKVQVSADSEDCWLFVVLTENGKVTVGETNYDFDDFLSYEIATGWTVGTGLNSSNETDDTHNGIPTNVIYRKISESSQKGENAWYSILEDNQVTVRSTVTKEMMAAVPESGDDQITLTFQAYASQLYKSNTGGGEDETEPVEFTVLEAWKNVSTATYNDEGANKDNGNTTP